MRKLKREDRPIRRGNVACRAEARQLYIVNCRYIQISTVRANSFCNFIVNYSCYIQSNENEKYINVKRV